MSVQVKNSTAQKKSSFQFYIYCILILQKKALALRAGRLTKTTCQENKLNWIKIDFKSENL